MIISESDYYRDDERRNVRSMALACIQAHGDNNSIGKYDRWILRMIRNWADSGHDRDFIAAVINRSFEEEFGSEIIDESIDPSVREYWNYLERLRRSGVTNMFGAVPYLMDEFNLSRNEASKILSDWMQNYNRDDYKDLTESYNGYKYAVYFTWNDGTRDSFNCTDAKERNISIKDMIDRKDFKYIGWCKIISADDYGEIHDVLGSYVEDY